MQRSSNRGGVLRREGMDCGIALHASRAVTVDVTGTVQAR